MKIYQKSYCPSCDSSVELSYDSPNYSCAECSSPIEYPQCANKTAFELLVDIDAPKKIPKWAYPIILVMLMALIVELFIYLYPFIRLYILVDNYVK